MARVKVRVQLNLHGIVSIKSARAGGAGKDNANKFHVLVSTRPRNQKLKKKKSDWRSRTLEWS
ncbi:hypothetical protein S245_058148 [Arachis hypogaea]